MKNEYDRLTKVIVSEPKYMKITEIINEVQKKYIKENINTNAALRQHRLFIEMLKKENVEVIYLENMEELNEQVFTRDIGFTVNNKVCVCNLKENVRKKEKEMLTRTLIQKNLTYYEFNHEIEGGDVIVHHNTIFVGVGNRTAFQAVEELKQQFPEKEIVEVELSEGILHLDCVFNIIDEKTALIYKEGMNGKSLSLMEELFTLIPITKEEEETMGTNVLSIGNKKIISLNTQERINKLLRNSGFAVIEVEFSEIIKSGGSFRCCTLPLERV